MDAPVDINSKLFHAAVQHSHEMLGLAAEDGTVLYASPRVAEGLGISIETLLGTKTQDWIHPTDQPRFQRIFEQVLATGTGKFDAYRIRCGDGSWRWKEATASLIVNEDHPHLVIINAHDISKHKETVTALQQSQESLLRAQRLAHLGYLERTLSTGKSYWSDETFRILGYAPQSFEPGRERILEHIHPDDREKLTTVAHALYQYGTPYDIEHRIIRVGGEVGWVRAQAEAVRDEQGQIARFVCTVLDVTEHKQTQEALSNAYNDLERRVQERTEQLAEAKDVAERASRAKSDFLSNMSHELRTPLNAILGFGQILQLKPPKLTRTQEEGVNHILSAGQHLLTLINDVLDIARVETGELEFSPEPVLLHTVIEESRTLIKPLASQKGVSLDFNHNLLCDHYVFADHQRLRQVIINLLSNAIKYNSPGGKVFLRCHEVENQRLQIQVRDTGQGIKPQDLARLFKPFERLETSKHEVEGTGLGLALSKYMIEAMQGTIGVESQWGQGSTFHIEFQQMNKAPQPQSLEADTQATTSVERQRYTWTVLSIEDNVANFQLIEAIMESRPQVKLLQAFNGYHGLELAKQHHPNLIFLDLHLPDIPGDEVLQKLRESSETRDIRVVVISADATKARIQKLLAAGAREYLTKPLNVAGFLRTLDELL